MIIILLSVIAVLLAAIAVILFIRKEKKTDPDKMLEELKTVFQSVSFDTLKEQSGMGEKALEEKKKLIDQSLKNVEKELAGMREFMDRFGAQSKSGFDVISERLRSASDTTTRLAESTENLKNVLSNPSARGQWGEKMAEDVLRLAGFMENVNYIKQRVQSTGKKPDFTFILPKGMKVNMDSKFPFANYLKYVEAGGEQEKIRYKKQFLADVKLKIKEVTNRDYINPEENTVDYVILFIPNEQVYSFINECDPALVDNAMKQKVIVCSPLTLYAILAVIRQAMDNFNFASRTNEIFRHMEDFKKQWSAFADSMSKMGRALEAAQKEFGILTTTRVNQVDRVVRKIDDLKNKKELGR